MTCRDKKEWRAAMVDDLGSLAENDIYSVENKPNNRKVIKCCQEIELKRDSR